MGLLLMPNALRELLTFGRKLLPPLRDVGVFGVQVPALGLATKRHYGYGVPATYTVDGERKCKSLMLMHPLPVANGKVYVPWPTLRLTPIVAATTAKGFE
jgi:hypothetical protein